MRRRSMTAAVLVLAGLVGGCCSHPGVFQKLERSLATVQTYYGPLLEENLQNEMVKRAVVAADTTLLLAGELQGQWCPPAKAVEQVALQSEEAKKMALEAGVKATENAPEAAGSSGNEPAGK